jgi:dTDP-4-amino-4,6-dideoxy-D-galactose acyltransferase
MEQPCQLLSWDSDFFGYKIGKVISRRLSPEHVASIQIWSEQNGVECLYLLADADHDETALLAEQNGFHLVDLRMTLIRKNHITTSEAVTNSFFVEGIGLRPVQSLDIDKLETIARTAYTDTRFYYDHHFSHSQCSELYATWIRRSCEDFADQVLIAEYNSKAVGYITCKRLLGENSKGAIGLMAVDSTMRGKGIGSALVKYSLEWFIGQGIQEVQVVTQGRNVMAQRIYQRCGFISSTVHLWYHRWSVCER